MNEELIKRAREIIEKILYLTIATVSEGGQPWNSPVYSAFDEGYNFYWVSWKENQHSRNIETNDKIFLVIYDSTAKEGEGWGVYIQAKASMLTDGEEIINAWKSLDDRVGKAKQRNASDFQGEMPRRVYKAVPQKVWINVDGEVNGQYADKRVEIKL